VHRSITEEELDRHLDTQFNPPTLNAEFTRESFYAEWKAVQSMIKAALESLGYSAWNEGGEDYTMPDDWGYSRHHEIEINRRKMLDARIVPLLQQILHNLPHDYEIVVQHDLFLRDNVKPCSLIIRRDEVLSQTEDESLLRQFWPRLI
jgi:hypothetical protein